jgi:hypothetical protein
MQQAWSTRASVRGSFLVLVPLIFADTEIGSQEPDPLINPLRHLGRPDPRMLVAARVCLVQHIQGNCAAKALAAQGWRSGYIPDSCIWSTIPLLEELGRGSGITAGLLWALCQPRAG